MDKFDLILSFQSAKEKYDNYKEMGLLSMNIKSKIFK